MPSVKIKYEHRFKGIGAVFSAIYWFSDSLIHFFTSEEVHFEWVPNDIHELWMRAIIILLVVITSSYADHYTYLLRKKDQEKLDVFNETVRASHHILNNLLNQMIYYKILAEESHDFDHDELVKFDNMLNDAKAQILALEHIQTLTVDNIKKLYP